MQRLIILFLFLALTATAQDIPEMRLVGKPTLAEDEFVGVRDDDGDLCAAIKVISDMENFRYTSYNGVVRVDDGPGQDMVYVSADERVLEIFHSGYKPQRIILHEAGIHLESQQVWQIQVTGDAEQEPIPVTILTDPENGQIRIDGKSPTRKVQHLLRPGMHRLAVTQKNCIPVDTVVHVDRDNAFIRVKLKPRTKYGSVDISVTPADALIVLKHKNGQTFRAKGSHTFTELPVGTFQYRVTHSDYETKTGQINVNTGRRLKGNISLQPLSEGGSASAGPDEPEMKKRNWIWWTLGAAIVGGGGYYYLMNRNQPEQSTVLHIEMPNQVSD